MPHQNRTADLKSESANQRPVWYSENHTYKVHGEKLQLGSWIESNLALKYAKKLLESSGYFDMLTVSILTFVCPNYCSIHHSYL